ncbi:MAG: hypothetical protein H3C49_10540 [Alphaproteobacteria bacterium]|nr:hypothetical protein [Alphaproteobacteria bacterium]
MPLLSLVWATVVLLSVLIYTACSFYNKDLKKYHFHFAAGTFVICALLACIIEFTLRSRGILMLSSYSGLRTPSFTETVLFYAKHIALYGGAYVLLLKIKKRALKITFQVLFIFIFSCFYYYSYGLAIGGYGVEFRRPICLCNGGGDLCDASVNYSGAHHEVVLFWPRIFREFAPPYNCG